MVRNYVRRTNQQLWNEIDMRDAVQAVRKQNISFKEAAVTYHVPASTLFRRVSKRGDVAEVCKKTIGRFRTCFSPQQEQELVNFCLYMEKRLFGITLKNLQYLAFEFAEENLIIHPFNKEKRRAGRDWVFSFLRRYPEIILKTSNKSSLPGVADFNKNTVVDFLYLLMDIRKLQNLMARNLDSETGNNMSNKPANVSNLKEK